MREPTEPVFHSLPPPPPSHVSSLEPAEPAATSAVARAASSSSRGPGSPAASPTAPPLTPPPRSTDIFWIHLLRSSLYNLLIVGERDNSPFNPANYPSRTSNGKYNHPSGRKIGSQDTFYGRNMPPVEQKDQVLSPDPVVVVTKLLGRTLKDPGKQFNLIAASWIQFQIHDWVDHLEDTGQRYPLQERKMVYTFPRSGMCRTKLRRRL